jgi:drug/metabolite transporter (DMT)-like permease
MVFTWMKEQKQWPLYAACFFFALMALSVKLVTSPGWASTDALPALQVTFFRSALCLVLVFPLMCRELKSYPVTRDKCKPLFLRSLAGGLAMIAYFQAIAKLPLATAVLLNYTSPMWAGLFAWLFLHEALSAGVVLAYPLAFAGVCLVVGGPGATTDGPGVLLALSSAVLAGAAYTALRGLRGTPPGIVVTGLCSVTMLVTGPLCYASYQPPTASEWGLLWLCGAASAVAQILLTLGYRVSSTASASTVGLATVAVSALLSRVVLGDQLAPGQWFGMLVLLWATSQTGKRSVLARTVRGWYVLCRRPSLSRV